MAKNRIVFIILITVLALSVVAAFLLADRKPPDSPRILIPKLEPSKTVPNSFEPTLVESKEIEPLKAVSDKSESKKNVPKVTERPKTEPNVPNSTTPKADRTEPVKPEPNEAKTYPKVTFHDKCTGILKTFVDDKGMVDYRTLKRKRLELRKLLEEFANLKPNEYKTWSPEDKIAFWINAYNIQMLNIIINNYPIDSYRWLHLLPNWEPDSILHINRRVDGLSNQKFYVMEEEFTLQKVEDRFFRKEFDEPRAFFALCYAHLSSPPLRNKPYRGTTLSQQLDDQAKKFLSSPLAFKINNKKRTVYLSHILTPTWFGKEFINKYGTDKKFKDQEPAVRAVLNCLINYLSRRDTNYLKLENYSIEYMRPNWRLNDSSGK